MTMPDRTAYWREYAYRRYHTDPVFRARKVKGIRGHDPQKPMAGDYAKGSIHHADEHLRCFTCRVAWPCSPFIEARRKAAPKTILVFPEQS